MGSNHQTMNLVFPNLFLEFLSVWAVEKEKENLIGPKLFFLTLPVEKEIIINIYKKKL